MQVALFVKNCPVAHYQQTVDRLLQLMQQRLMVQHDVARWKWNQKSSIEAPQREQELLSKRRQQATNYDLDPDTAVIFFQRQIQAGKLIQVANFQNWQRKGEGFFPNVPSLNHILRPFLDKLDLELLSVLATLNPVLDCSTTQEHQLIHSRAQIIFQGDGIDTTVRHVALVPLNEVQKSCLL
ncbi:MAG: gamma subclass chorismate mutase AroQ, partial [Chroococcidiopsidaceae cyanobacterium CP_BM_ER_R8_30]|nr:gamma subclass chorismate mutase AroQ [Chroococcidiopsidaceae cyanobacterium CP_BM_ER_R8_30]